jgi:C-terminal processing protease CtpA/Prc
VAETVAAVLVRTHNPPTFGSPTRGRTMEYQTAPVSATHALRFAAAEMRLPDGTSLFRKGLTPSITSPFNQDAKHRNFAAQRTDGVKKSITSTERPRDNEHALVTRTAPELPHLLAQSAGKRTEFDQPPLHDLALQQAVDVLEARSFLTE